MAWEGSTSNGFPANVRRRILRRDPTCRCHGCTACTTAGCTRPSTEADHVIEVADGGSHHETNGQGICHPCHQRKTLAHAIGKRRAKAAARWREPEQHPGHRHGA